MKTGPLGNSMRLVRQQDACGCVVASLAMVTGRSYAEVRDWFVGCDLVGHGLTHHDAEDYLGETGYATVRRYRRLPTWVVGEKLFDWEYVRPDGRVQGRRDPWPTPPFAPAHLVGINGGRHCVAMTAEGLILDPSQDSPRTLAECGEVSYVIGVFQLPTNK